MKVVFVDFLDWLSFSGQEHGKTRLSAIATRQDSTSSLIDLIDCGGSGVQLWLVWRCWGRAVPLRQHLKHPNPCQLTSSNPEASIRRTSTDPTPPPLDDDDDATVGRQNVQHSHPDLQLAEQAGQDSISGELPIHCCIFLASKLTLKQLIDNDPYVALPSSKLLPA
jgi:hypothetical protein